MRLKNALTLTLGFLLLGASPPTGASLKNGIWAGTMTFGNRSTYFTVAFPGADAADDRQGDLYFPKRSEIGSPLSFFSASGSTVAFDVPQHASSFRFSGSYNEQRIYGTVSAGLRTGSFYLQHLIRLIPKELEPYVGFYRASDREIGIARPYTYLMFLDKESGRMGFLWPAGRDSFFSGPSKGIHYPATATIRFERDRHGEVSSLSLWYGNKSPIIARRMPAFATRELSFAHAGAILTGTLFLPRGRPPFPAVLLLAGSNYQTRSGQNALLSWVGDVFLRHGLAVFAYDKRGAGYSTGRRDDSHTVDDAISGYELLRKQPEADPRCTGIWGISQGGMAAPQVAAATGHVAFIVNTSGAIVNGNLQEIERTALEMRADGFSAADIRDAVRVQTLKFHYAMTGQGWREYTTALREYRNQIWLADPYIGPPDNPKSPAFAFWKAGGTAAPADSWKLYHGPTLYIDGENETNQDPKVNIAAFRQAMSTSRNSNYRIVIVKGADHSMLLDPRGGNTIDRLLSRYDMAYFDDLAHWIAAIPCARR